MSRNNRFTAIWLGLTLAWGAAAAVHQPEAPDRLRALAAKAHREGRRPVVILDIDDTLTDTRTRTRRILRALAGRVAAGYPREAAVLSRVELRDVRYHLGDTLDGLGIRDVRFREKAAAFWQSAFFSDAYAALDTPFRGAAAYVRGLVSAGAHVVYLTGRDAPRMGEGTRRGLRAGGFPLGRKATLMLKPDKEMDDVAFKVEAFRAIARLGTVVGGIDNEPANVNAMKRAFPRAFVLFIDTRHSGKPVQPLPSIPWFGGYGTGAAPSVGASPHQETPNGVVGAPHDLDEAAGRLSAHAPTGAAAPIGTSPGEAFPVGFLLRLRVGPPTAMVVPVLGVPVGTDEGIPAQEREVLGSRVGPGGSVGGRGAVPLLGLR